MLKINGCKIKKDRIRIQNNKMEVSSALIGSRPSDVALLCGDLVVNNSIIFSISHNACGDGNWCKNCLGDIALLDAIVEIIISILKFC